MWQGKNKGLTFSFDDGVTQDIRLIKLLDKYNLKSTFNVNSGFFGMDGSLRRNGMDVSHVKVKRELVREIYSGHEIAAHTLTHPTLTFVEERDEVVRQVEGDRVELSHIAGYNVVGFAFPGGGINHDKRVEDIVRRGTNCKYARTTDSTYLFDMPENLFCLNPTVSFLETDKMFSLGEEFLALKTDTPKMFYIWGHSYELDGWDFWDRFEQFCQMISGKDDIFYGTNKDLLCHM